MLVLCFPTGHRESSRLAEMGLKNTSFDVAMLAISEDVFSMNGSKTVGANSPTLWTCFPVLDRLTSDGSSAFVLHDKRLPRCKSLRVTDLPLGRTPTEV